MSPCPQRESAGILPGTVRHRAGTFLISGASGNRDLYIAHRLNADTPGANNTGAYHFGGEPTSPPALEILQHLFMGGRIGERAFLSLSGHGTFRVAGDLGEGYVHAPNTVFTILDAGGAFQYREGTAVRPEGRFGNVADNDLMRVGGHAFRAKYVQDNEGTRFTITALP